VSECDEEYEECYEEIVTQSADVLSAYLQTEGLQEYRVPVVEKNGKRFWAVRIDMDNYYAQFPQKPYWVCKLNDELSKLRPKRMPMSDAQVYDLYKKHFGFKKVKARSYSQRISSVVLLFYCLLEQFCEV
jgi:hypothetical protein